MHPAHDARHGGLGTHTGYGIAHAQIGAHGSIKDTIKNTENICCGTSNIHTDDINSVLFSNGLQYIPYRSRCGHDGCIRPLDQSIIARRMGHDVFQEKVMYRIPCGTEVFLFQCGSKIFNDG